MNNDFASARLAAERYLLMLEAEQGGGPYTIIYERIREEDDGWYFPYQSKKFLMTGNIGDSLVGNWPIFVRRIDFYVGPRRPGMKLPPTQDKSNDLV